MDSETKDGLAVLATIIVLAIVVIGGIHLLKFVPSPCDDQCMIHGLDMDMQRECKGFEVGTPARSICEAGFNEEIAKYSTKGD